MKLYLEVVALRVIVGVVLDNLGNRPSIRKQLIIACMDVALQSDDFDIPATVAELLDPYSPNATHKAASVP